MFLNSNPAYSAPRSFTCSFHVDISSSALGSPRRDARLLSSRLILFRAWGLGFRMSPKTLNPKRFARTFCRGSTKSKHVASPENPVFYSVFWVSIPEKWRLCRARDFQQFRAPLPFSQAKLVSKFWLCYIC